jgi:hypothetical protein
VLEHAGQKKALGARTDWVLTMLAGDPIGARKHYEEHCRSARQARAAALAVLSLLADMTWQLGDLDAALAAFVETVARLRQSPLARKYVLGVALINRGRAHQRGELDEALLRHERAAVAHDAGMAWNVLDHLALRAALAAKFADAARLPDAIRHAPRKPYKQCRRARNRLHALLGEQLAPTNSRAYSPGAQMTRQACRLALEVVAPIK